VQITLISDAGLLAMFVINSLNT